MKRIVLSLLMLAAAAGGALAATLEVPGAYPTIQAAINAANPGDVLNIAAGTYNEAIVVDKHVDLIGAGSGTNPAIDTIITQTAAGVPDSRVGVIQLAASGASAADPILLRNLRVAPVGIAGISVGLFTGATGTSVAYVELDDVHVVGTNTNPATEQERGLYVDNTSSLTHLVVSGSAFDNLSYGWYTQKAVSADASNLRYVAVSGTTFNHCNLKGLYAEKLSDASFNNCTISGNGFDPTGVPLYFVPFMCGVDVNLKAGTYQNIAFNGCTITNNGLGQAREGAGLTVKGRGTGVDSATYLAFPALVSNVNVSGCIVTGNERGVRFGEPGKSNTTPTNVVVTGCTLMNNVQTYSGVDGSSYGDMVNQTTATTAAAANWWGDLDPSNQVSGIGGILFSPWLGAAPGTSPMTWYVNTTGTIQAAINAANPGDVIEVGAGTYDENLNINKSITINGPNAVISPNTETRVAEAVLRPSVDTAITGIANGITVVIKGLTVDMDLGVNLDDRTMTQIGKTGTSWTFENNIFKNAPECGNGQWYISGTSTGMQFTLLDNLFTGNNVSNGIALWSPEPTTLDIEDNVWENNGYTAMNINHAQGVIKNNIFRDTRTIDFGDPGYTFSTFQSGILMAGDLFDLEISNNQFSNVQYGVIMYANVDGVIDIANNTFDGVAISAVRASGAQAGSGDLNEVTVSGNEFLNYFGTGFVVTNARVDGAVLNAEGNWWGSATGPYHATTNPSGTGFAVSDNVDFNPWSGTAIASATPATSGPINCGQNVVITFGYTPDLLTPPMYTYNAVVKASPGVNFGTITDLVPFGLAGAYWYKVDNGVSLVDGYHRWTITGSTTGTGLDSHPVTGAANLFSIQFLPASDGTALIAVESLVLRDPSNSTIPVNLPSASILIDCTIPAAVTDITAAPAHNKVNVAWTHGGSDTFTYEIYRGLWHDGTLGVSAYPEYDDWAADVIPTRPANRAAAAASPLWTLAGSVGVGLPRTFVDLGTTSRGVYYYEVFAVDTANNGSLAAAANKRATNYWLGDVAAGFNGQVNAIDMNDLGAVFGTSLVLGAPANRLDVGPTDNMSRLGVPMTDDFINFEDLIVFAMNFGVVTAAKSEAPAGTSVDLAWVQYDDGSMALRLVNGAGLKGLRVTANVPVGSVTAGSLLDQQSELTFLKNVGETLDVSVAVMGVGTTFTGSGDLFVIAAGAAITPEDLTISARAIDNSKMSVTMSGAIGGQATPRVFALNDNYPNPFNPMTKISFSLPDAQSVRLSVYSLDGRKVATLMDETRAAGLHEVVWTGRDDAGQGVASGTYFYRLDAGPYSDVRKMTLMK